MGSKFTHLQSLGEDLKEQLWDYLDHGPLVFSNVEKTKTRNAMNTLLDLIDGLEHEESE